jgi:hypothetical protein
VLEAAGSDFSRIVKLNVYLKSFADFQAMNEVYITHFGDVKPVSRPFGPMCVELGVVLNSIILGADVRCGGGPAVQCDCGDGMHGSVLNGISATEIGSMNY